MKKTLFIKNALVLTVSSFILRFLGIIFKIWLAGAIGSEGIGLYQLVFSVFVLASTFATSGISTAVTRLCADELALGSKKGTLRILRRSLVLSLILAAISVFIFFFGAEFIALSLMGEGEAVLPLKVMSLTLPSMAISSCLKGYFIARRKAYPSASSQILEQLIRLGVVFYAIKNIGTMGIGLSCAAVMLGDTVSEGVSALYLGFLLKFDTKKLNSLEGRAYPDYGVTKEIMRISLPIMSGRYLGTLLRTAENILVPRFLKKYPYGSGGALSQFGMIKGMALPLIFFPSTLLNSLSTLLIPEMSEASALGRKQLVKYSVEKIISVTAILSLIVSAVFLFLGEDIGILVYKNTNVGGLLTALSPLIPFMYLDSIADGLLKGLDLQNYTFKHSVSDSLIRLVLVCLLLSRYGLKGFIGIMYFSNLYTCILNLYRLIKTSRAKISPLKSFILPYCFAVISVLFFRGAAMAFNMPRIIYVISVITLSVLGYLFLLNISGILKIETLKSYLK